MDTSNINIFEKGLFGLNLNNPQRHDQLQTFDQHVDLSQIDLSKLRSISSFRQERLAKSVTKLL